MPTNLGGSMNKLIFAFSTILVSASLVQAATNPYILFFQNGDVLKGTLQSVDAKKLHWQRDDVVKSMDFDLTNVTRVDFGATEPAQTPSTNTWRVRLSNDDLLEGTITSCENDTLIFDTTYAGKLKIPRKNVHSITLVSLPESALFSGPSSLDGWTQGKSALAGDSGQWTYRNGAFYASKSASIARDVKLPPMASIQFDLRWQGTLHAAIALYNNSLLPVSLLQKENEPDFGGFYSFMLNSSFADLLAITKRDPNRSLGPVAVPFLTQTNAAHIELRANTAAHSISLYINDIFVKEWVDPAGFIGEGTAIRIVHQGLGTLKLSNLRITKWNGVSETKSAVKVVNLAQDVATLANGTVLTGRFQSITNGQVTLVTNFAPALVPLSSLTRLDLSPETDPNIPPVPGQVRALIHGTGRITFQIDQWNKSQVTGHSAILGQIKCNPAAFSALQWVKASP